MANVPARSHPPAITEALRDAIRLMGSEPAAAILRAVVTSPGLTTRDAAALAGTSESAALRHLKELARHELVQQVQTPGVGRGGLATTWHLGTGDPQTVVDVWLRHVRGQ